MTVALGSNNNVHLQSVLILNLVNVKQNRKLCFLVTVTTLGALAAGACHIG